MVAVVSLAAGCASSTHSTAGGRDYYAQAAYADSVTCCVQSHPGNPEA